MIQAEFNRWWDDLLVRFPSIESWLMRAASDELAQRRLLQTWRDVMRDVDLATALDINRQMQSGDSPFVADFHEQDIPGHVRRLARQLSWERDGRIEPEDHPRLEGGSGFPGAKILLRLWELKRTGMSHDEARAQALREIPVGDSRYREQRYNCGTCLDSGRVLVASNTAIEMMLAGSFSQCHHRDAVMRCTCQAGQRLVRKSHGRDLPWETFNTAADFAISDPLWREPEIARFAQWVDVQRDSRAESMAQTAASYDQRFTEWNNR